MGKYQLEPKKSYADLSILVSILCNFLHFWVCRNPSGGTSGCFDERCWIQHDFCHLNSSPLGSKVGKCRHSIGFFMIKGD
ncbi:unnamed protein product [marine sediment metagenome]|uniref:Uncharacterized protein n=1 Tax=marine sediment metagenome TaxID=412755 RepID=X1FJX4_9ZZZZ